MKTIEYRDVLDRKSPYPWPSGPWDSEPDKIQWEDERTKLPCLAVRNALGAWCGYVGVPEGHKLYGKGYDDVDVDVHGGLTFANKCMEGPESNVVCHIPDPGEPDHVWWFGFDCVHCMDLAPGMVAIRTHLEPLRRIEEQYPHVHDNDRYRTLAYVKEQVASLALQLGGLA